jgi:hypothetical protein
VITVTRSFDHLLESWPAVVPSRSAGFDKFSSDMVPVGKTPRAQLTTLVRNG